VTTFSTPSERELAVTRVFDAPREAVFGAWTSPATITSWMLGPDGWSMPVCDVDLRPGGAWRFAWRGPDGRRLELDGIYREVSPPEKLVFTESWGGEWPQTLNTIILSAEEGATRLTYTVEFVSTEARAAAFSTGMSQGMTQSLDRLAAHLATTLPER